MEKTNDAPKKKVSRAIVKLPKTSLGKHESERAITIEASKGDTKYGEFSISQSGIQYKDHDGQNHRRSWKSLAKFISKGKKST